LDWNRDVRKARLRKQEESTIDGGTSLRKRSNPAHNGNGAMICYDTVTLPERVKRWLEN